MTSHSHDHNESLADLLDLDAQVLHRYLSDVMSWVQGRAAGRPSRRILDVGAGTGTGTIALARQFVGANVVAVDLSAEMLQRVQDRAAGEDRSRAGRPADTTHRHTCGESSSMSLRACRHRTAPCLTPSSQTAAR